jgi:hypothetical protein
VHLLREVDRPTRPPVVNITCRVPIVLGHLRVNVGAALGVGVILGALGVAAMILVFGSPMFSGRRGPRIVLLPLLCGFLVGKLFPVMELEEPPTDRR